MSEILKMIPAKDGKFSLFVDNFGHNICKYIEKSIQPISDMEHEIFMTYLICSYYHFNTFGFLSWIIYLRNDPLEASTM